MRECDRLDHKAGQPDFTMLIGPDQSGELIEVGVSKSECSLLTTTTTSSTR
jgi:hypothetical protein